jgi:hypothetical protein
VWKIRFGDGAALRLRLALLQNYAALVPQHWFVPVLILQSFSLLNEKSLISEGEEPRQYRLLTANETAYIYTRYTVPLIQSNIRRRGAEAIQATHS